MRSFILYVFLSFSLSLSAQIKFNGNFEQLDKYGRPIGWDLTFGNKNTYQVKLDSSIRRQGKYAISIASADSKENASAISFKIEERFKGKHVMLIASIKTENVTNGFAGVWLRTDGANGKVLEFENMEIQQLKGTNDWKEYFIEIPYQQESVVQLNVGALLVGRGKIWVDSLRLLIDRIPVEKAKIISPSVFGAASDTTFSKGSRIDTIIVNDKNKKYLNLTGQLWGFLKYHHPTVAKGNLNWDAELFNLLPLVLKCQTDQQVSNLMEKWIDKLGVPPLCASCSIAPSSESIALKPDYGSLFNNAIFSTTLVNKLNYILANRNIASNYYVSINSSYGDFGNPMFDNERLLPGITYPDVGYRILSLFRYWNMIQYFFPSRHLIPGQWTSVLNKYLPEIVLAKDKKSYMMVWVKVISSIHDSHANIHSIVYEDIKGKYRLPLKIQFVENQLVVSGFYSDTDSIKDKFKIGDIVKSINGEPVNKLIDKYLPITSASNYEGQLMRLSSNYLMRSNNPIFEIGVLRDGEYKKMTSEGVEEVKLDFHRMDLGLDPSAPEYFILPERIAYIHAGRFNTDWKEIKDKLDETKGIIIDLRTYPRSGKTNEMIDYFKRSPSPFVKYTSVKTSYPGLFLYSTSPVNIGIQNSEPYKGKIIVLVNYLTLSWAEAATMVLQSSKNVIVIGSITAGADGAVSRIFLPGEIETGISGIGMYYPDGTNTQRVGVKIDYIVKPTIKGIKNGIDEPLEKAKQLINGI